jgi:hypothetical protein
MGVPLDEFMDRFSAEERQAIDARAQELIAEEISLRDLRKALGRTQAALAAKLGLKQENVSRVEARTDMLLSTLDGYLRAMGGRLRLTVEFKDRPPVLLSGLAQIAAKKAGTRLTDKKTAPARTQRKRAGPARTPPKPPGVRRAATSAGSSASKRPTAARARVDARSMPTVIAVVAVRARPVACIGGGGPVGGGGGGEQLQPPRIVALRRLRAVQLPEQALRFPVAVAGGAGEPGARFD